MNKTLYFPLGIIQLFVSFGALICGALMVFYPSGDPLNMPLEILAGSAFHSFFIPGIILFTVNGLGQLAAGLLTFKRHHLTGYAGAVFGMGLMIWIFIQVSMIGGGNILQYAYFAIGLIETVLAFLIQAGAAKKSRGFINTRN